MKGDYLGAFEELVLLAVAGVGEDAYGVSVQERVERDAERPVSLGAVYASLDRLERKAYIRSWIGESGQYRGGRRKRHFTITADGTRVSRRDATDPRQDVAVAPCDRPPPPRLRSSSFVEVAP